MTSMTSLEGVKEENEVDIDMSINKGFISFFMVVACVPGLLIGYSFGYANECSELMNLRFHWDTKPE